MITLLRNAPILSALVAWLTFGNWIAVAQSTEKQNQQEHAAFKGIHSNRGVNGRPDTVTITDGQTYLRVTEQEYRERGYTPEFDRLPVLIIQRIPVRQKHDE